jgi:AraC-like DNA-binding protein
MTASPDENLAQRPGVYVEVSVAHPTGRGSRDPNVLLHHPPFSLDGQPLSTFLQYRDFTYDTYDGLNAASGPDWYAIHFPEPTAINCIEMTMECPNRDGGWWTSLNVEWLNDNGWQPVDKMDIAPAYSFEDVPYTRRPYDTHVVTFVQVVTRAVRLIGQPGGLAQFTSLAYLAVFCRDLTRWNPTSIPEPPVPYLFRLIPPHSIWDLSESLVKLTGLAISVASMDHYLDQNRYERWWRRIRRNYTGEPELWALLGMRIGWDIWNRIFNPDEERDALLREPYVRLSFHNTIGQASAPIVVDNQLLGEIVSHQVIVPEHFDPAWHREYAQQQSIDWDDYMNAVRRSPHLTIEQLEGAAMLMGMIANTIANLAHRNRNLEQELIGARSATEKRETERRALVRNAIDFMQANLEEKITVADAARHVALSSTYFGILFRQQIGCSPVEYLVNLRLERAKAYLSQTNMTVMDVCVALGYDSSYFNRLFKRYTGLTPGQFARRVRGNK